MKKLKKLYKLLLDGGLTHDEIAIAFKLVDEYTEQQIKRRTKKH